LIGRSPAEVNGTSQKAGRKRSRPIAVPSALHVLFPARRSRVEHEAARRTEHEAQPSAGHEARPRMEHATRPQAVAV
jgi:hypothetical protein